ncbi:Crp/Fnr family transcriptional regulator [bacterium]|nr:Crp/Fnr family transcriptional regulator [bacterium]
MDKKKHIAETALFSGLNDQQHEELAKIAIEKKCRKKQMIFTNDDEGLGFYIVISGQVRIFRISPDGKEQIIHVIGEGEPFGEVAVFSNGNYPAYADALRDSILLFFPRDRFIELVKMDSSLSMKMLADLSGRLRELVSKVEELSLKDVPARLATYLLLQSEQNDNSDIVHLEISKSQLANLLGTIPETLSRIMRRMVSDDIIAFTKARSIRILSHERLNDLAFGELRLSRM